VKARTSVAAAVEAVRPSLRRRLARGSDIWLSRNPRYAAATLRFDIMVVNPGRWPIHLPNAFETDQ
jgi:putative endonuclease